MSPSKRSASPIVTRSNLRGVLLRLSSKKNPTSTEITIMQDAKRRLNKCEATLASNATEALLGAGWKFETEASVRGGPVNVYYRSATEGLVFLKMSGNLTNEVINLVGCQLLMDALSGRTLRYIKSHGIKQRIFTNGWTPEHSHYVRDRFKGLIVLEDTSNVMMSQATRVQPPKRNEEKSFPITTQTTPVKPKRPSAFRNITPGTPASKRARLCGQ